MSPLGNTIALPTMHTKKPPRLPSHVTFHTTYLIIPSQILGYSTRFPYQFQSQPSTSSETGRFRFILTVYANLTLSMDQRIYIKRPGLYTDAGISARMPSHRLLRRTNGWWMRGMRHVPELTHILIHYAKIKRNVFFFVTCGTVSLGFSD